MTKRQRIRSMGNLAQLVEAVKSEKSRVIFRSQLDSMQARKKQLPLVTVTA